MFAVNDEFGFRGRDCGSSFIYVLIRYLESKSGRIAVLRGLLSFTSALVGPGA